MTTIRVGRANVLGTIVGVFLLYDQDITEYDQVKSIIEDVYLKFGQIDIL